MKLINKTSLRLSRPARITLGQAIAETAASNGGFRHNDLPGLGEAT